MQKALLLFAFISTSLLATAQTGSITGTITDGKTKEAIIGGSVLIQGTQLGTSTDIEGKFTLGNLKPGTYNLTVSYVAYQTAIVPNVVVEAGKITNVTFDMQEEAGQLEAVVITGTRETNTDFSVVRSIKESKLVVTGISAEQISRSLDRDAAQVLKRVPGITIKDDQFIISRGLAERYNPVMLHNTYAPSVETDVRSFSFATIPSNQLDRIMVYKSPAADLPGDFAGSVVKIYTKSIPDENGWVIDYSTQVRAGSTFEDFYHQKRNPGFLTGYNTGYYDLPSSFPKDASNLSDADQENAGRALKNNLWSIQKGVAVPDQRLNVVYNAKFDVGNVKIGTINGLSYSNAYAIYDVRRGDYTLTDPNYEYKDQQYNQQVRTGLISNWAVKINGNHLIEFKNLYNISSNDQLVQRYGVEGSVSGGQANRSYDKIYRGIYSGQLMGKHDLFDKATTVEWVAGYNNTYRDQPDYKRFLTNSGQMNIPNTVTPQALGRFYSALNENSYSGGISVRQILPFSKDALRSPELKAGIFFENKERTFHARNIGYTTSPGFDNNLKYLSIEELMQDQNINNTNGIEVDEITYRKDSYTAKNNLLAYYLMASLPIGSKFQFDGGVRVEDNLQQLISYDDFAGVPVNFHSPVTRLLPSANFSYNFTEKMLVRAAYGQTLNRPEFRELAPFTFYDFNFNFILYGNPSLKTAKIQNYDLRWEWYPSKSEMITFGGFYKDFTNPIESYIAVTSGGGGVKDVYFDNSKSAKVYGIELEVKKSLNELTGSAFLNNLSVMVNTTLLKSKAQVADAWAAGRTTSRPLQGQSPYVVNAGIYYNSDESGWQVNALYNIAGKTIYFIGHDYYRDVYVMPRNVIDLTFTKRLSEKFSLKGGVTDILNQPIRYFNSGSKDGEIKQVIQKYRPGQVCSIGFTFKP